MKLRQTILIIGAILLGFVIILTIILPQKAANLPKGFDSPIIAFEFANSRHEIQMLYDFETKTEREAYIEGMKIGNYLDYVYMSLYTAFLIYVILWTAQKFRIKIVKKLSFIALLAFVADAIENIYLLKINWAMESNGQFMQFIHPLHLITWIKWFSLALVFAIIGLIWFKKNSVWKFANWIFFSPVLLAIASWFYKPYLSSAFTYAIMLAFLLAYINIAFNKFILKPNTFNKKT